jgi:hypothetical protein
MTYGIELPKTSILQAISESFTKQSEQTGRPMLRPSTHIKGNHNEAAHHASGTMADWSRKFDEPIPLAKGRQLITLKDAGTYIATLPKAEHIVPEWQAAMEALILVATHGGPTTFARIGIMRAFHVASP